MIESNYFWLNTFFLAVGTIAIRFSIISISSKVKISNELKNLFSFIPAAILPALIVPAVFFHKGVLRWAYEKERLLVLVISVAVCYFTRSTLATIVFGLTLLYFITQN